MLDINKIRKSDPKILVIGSYPVIQSILDFDFLAKKLEPSIVGVIGTGRNFEKYFFGDKEILVPIFKSFDEIPSELKSQINFFINVSSGRRCYSSTLEAIEKLPNLVGGNILAEDTPEKLSVDLHKKAKEKGIFIAGPSSVGFLIPNFLKLGVIGGVRYQQLVDAYLFEGGNVATFSSSGGMTNELIHMVNTAGKRVSFALSFGGDRFPILNPVEAFLAAEADPNTEYIVYFGELGGYDEYELVELIKSKKVTKKVIAYIAGVISDAFDKPTQFGHAKALAQKGEERAVSKRQALKAAGCVVPESFKEFVAEVKKIPAKTPSTEKVSAAIFENRKKSLITTSIVKEDNGDVILLGDKLIDLATQNSFAKIAVSMFLGHNIKSKLLEEFTDIVFKLLVDHGANVSGAVNTIITARAGKDLPSALAAGLLTIGPRFGGAINQAAFNWIYGVTNNKTPHEFIEEYSSKKTHILGIGHKKYRIDQPDPRVKALLEFTNQLKLKRFTNFAQAVEKITTSKKGNLILNVDGAVAAILLDILSEKEDYTDVQLMKLVENEFFNAFFVLPRTVGFISHFLDQKRLDEGLLRLDDELISSI